MATIYSTRLGEANISGAVVNAYTVPAGFVAVVRCITVLCIDSGAVAAVLRQGGIAVMFRVTSTAAEQYFCQEGRWVMNETEVLQFNAAGTGAIQFNVSGYVLEGP